MPLIPNLITCVTWPFILFHHDNGAQKTLVLESMRWMLLIQVLLLVTVSTLCSSVSGVPLLGAFIVGSRWRVNEHPGGNNNNNNNGSIQTRSSAHNVDNVDVAEWRNKSVKDLKKELQKRQIPCNHVFEKEELVRLVSIATMASTTTTTTHVEKDAETANVVVVDHQKVNDSAKSNQKITPGMIVTPLKLISLRGSEEVIVSSSSSSTSDPGQLKFQPTDQPFATMELQVQGGLNNDDEFTLNLMVDTACSGVVLKSSSVQEYQIPLIQQTPATSTGVSGVAERVELAEISNFAVGDERFDGNGLPAAVQNLDVIPKSIDGIIGLSFLSQFDMVEFDYTAERLKLYKDIPPNNNNKNVVEDVHHEDNEHDDQRVVVASGSLKMLDSLGVYVVDVWIGGRGPVSMIVDTGGSNTFLSWKGVSDLGLDRASKGVYKITESAGAVGNTGQAFALTHRIYVSSQLKLGSGSSSQTTTTTLPGLALGGTARLGIDIGDIPLLQSLASQNVGGILGLDVFTRCSAIRLKLKGNERTLTLLS